MTQHCLAVMHLVVWLGPHQLDIVVAEADDPLVKKVEDAAHLGLFGNQILLDFSALVVCEPMVVDSRVVLQPSHDFFFLLCEGLLFSPLCWLDILFNCW